MAEAIQGNIN